MNKVLLVGRLSQDAKQLKNGVMLKVYVTTKKETAEVPVFVFNIKNPSWYTKGRIVSVDAHIIMSKKDNKDRIYIASDNVVLIDTFAEKVDINDVVLPGEMADVHSFNERGKVHA